MSALVESWKGLSGPLVNVFKEKKLIFQVTPVTLNDGLCGVSIEVMIRMSTITVVVVCFLKGL